MKIEAPEPDAVPEFLRTVCTGRGPWLLQMKRAELRALLHLLAGQPAFFRADRPGEPIAWHGSDLSGVSEYLAGDRKPETETRNPLHETSGQPSAAALAARIIARAKHPAAAHPPSSIVHRPSSIAPVPGPSRSAIAHRPSPLTAAPTAAVVDGSEHFLAITLPSREHYAYAPLLEALKAAGFGLEPSNRKWWLRDRHRTLSFLARYWERLEQGWDATFTDNFLRNTAKLHRARVVATASETGDDFEVALGLDAGGAPDEAVQAQLAQGRGYVEHEGAVFLVSPAALERLHAAQQTMAGTPGAPLLHRSRHRIARHRVAELQEALEAASPDFQPPAAWRTRSEALRDLSRLAPAPLPAALGALLRRYQLVGAAWLHHLARHGLGGVLADEMGLGKTAQALGLLAALRGQQTGNRKPESGEREPEIETQPVESKINSAQSKIENPKSKIFAPSLVVCPASLVENWRREAARFTPELRVFIHHGAGRPATAAELAGCDLIVTSYGTLVRDRDLLAAIRFTCVIADEAQHAKNRRTQAATALRSLSADSRFCLTGTPVENSLDDLRSLFDFVLPGALAPVPTEARGDERAWHEQRLRRQTAPYILRRRKDQVATELPPKIEQIVWCEPTEAQQAFYAEVRTATEREIDALALAGRPEAQVRLAVLTQLLRLRQVCCDPRLVAKDGPAAARFSPADSAKLVAFREILEEALDDGHRLLVFSQFTSLLDLLREELAAQDVAFCHLDGSMSLKTRQAEVDRFQNDTTVPVFLISLKAGGTGLNLTGADTVVHFDPWWNPAVEAQATDRAHRIGQTRVVTSYKLVVAGTVEEKVLQLQETKRRLLADVFEASDVLTATLDLADLRELVR